MGIASIGSVLGASVGVLGARCRTRPLRPGTMEGEKRRICRQGRVLGPGKTPTDGAPQALRGFVPEAQVDCPDLFRPRWSRRDILEHELHERRPVIKLEGLVESPFEADGGHGLPAQ